MGRKKQKRAAKHQKMCKEFMKGYRFYVYSEVNGSFLGWEFDELDREGMESHWKVEVERCAFGDFVELYDNDELVRRFDGVPFAHSNRLGFN